MCFSCFAISSASGVFLQPEGFTFITSSQLSLSVLNSLLNVWRHIFTTWFYFVLSAFFHIKWYNLRKYPVGWQLTNLSFQPSDLLLRWPSADSPARRRQWIGRYWSQVTGRGQLRCQKWRNRWSGSLLIAHRNVSSCDGIIGVPILASITVGRFIRSWVSSGQVPFCTHSLWGTSVCFVPLHPLLLGSDKASSSASRGIL